MLRDCSSFRYLKHDIIHSFMPWLHESILLTSCSSTQPAYDCFVILFYPSSTSLNDQSFFPRVLVLLFLFNICLSDSQSVLSEQLKLAEGILPCHGIRMFIFGLRIIRNFRNLSSWFSIQLNLSKYSQCTSAPVGSTYPKKHSVINTDSVPKANSAKYWSVRS